MSTPEVHWDAGQNQWYIQLPNDRVYTPGRPPWADSKPISPELAPHVENITELTNQLVGTAYTGGAVRRPRLSLRIQECVANEVKSIEDAKLVEGLLSLFRKRLSSENESSNAVGVMANSHCSEQLKLTAIVAALVVRLGQVQSRDAAAFRDQLAL